MKDLCQGLRCQLFDVPERIESFLNSLNVGKAIAGYLPIDAVERLSGPVITPTRAQNNIRSVTKSDALLIVESALRTLV